MKDIIKFLTIFSYKQKKELLFIFFLMLIGGVLESVGIGAILPLISIMGQPDFLNTYPEIEPVMQEVGIVNHTDLVIVVAGLLVVLYILKNAFLTIELYIQRRFTMKQQSLYAREILATYLAKPYIFHVNSNSAQLLRDVNIGPQYLFNTILMSILYLLTEVITAISIWIMLVIVDPFTAIVVACVMSLIIIAIIRSFRGRIVRQGEIVNTTSVEYLKWINQSLGGIKETKILGKESFFLSEFSKSYEKNAIAFQIYYFLSDIPRIIIELLVIVGLLGLIIIKILLGDTPLDVIPVLGVLAMAAFRLMPSANRIVGFYNAIKNQMPFFNEIYDVLMEIKIRLTNNTEVMPSENYTEIPFRNVLQIKNVSFKYAKDKDLILDDISFEIAKGKFVGIIGPSGAGKTTLVDILLGLLKPTEGHIYCDDNDINQDYQAWQKNWPMFLRTFT